MATLSGKTILITGAASGIGRATAQACRQAGARIIGADLASVDEIQRALGAGADRLAVSLDVADEAAVQAAVAQADATFHGIDGLVNCAGIAATGQVHELSLAAWNRAVAVHLTGSFLVSKHVLPVMLRAQRGAIVNLASVYGMTGGQGNTPYNTVKGGILQLTRSMAADYGRAGVRVNAVSPGYIETPMTAMLDRAGALRDAFVAMHLLGRAGRPEEVARAILFLLSDDASFITGANLPVDGGFSAARVILS